MLGIGVVSRASKVALMISRGSSLSFAVQENKSMPRIKGNS